jgi:hypothetical protein
MLSWWDLFDQKYLKYEFIQNIHYFVGFIVMKA